MRPCVALGASALLLAGCTAAGAATSSVTLGPGDQVTVQCAGSSMSVSKAYLQRTVYCKGTTPTPTPTPTPSPTSGGRPPAGGYFSLVPVGQFTSLPTDSQAAAMVHYSSWEPRPANDTANHTVPPAGFSTAGYSGMVNHAAVFGRVDGQFTGTTDEIIQWVAAKWGLPDEVIRADAVDESSWYQNLKDASGNPVAGKGYGDFGSCGVALGSTYPASGPSSFGLLQDKWCQMKDHSAAGTDGWPYTENDTAYAVDLYAAVIRGCYEGWDTWLGGSYTSGDLWGCLGRWYSGGWRTTAANDYISRVQGFYDTKPWLSW